jgi:hypothetical protein
MILILLTPKIGTGKRLTCEPNLQKNTIRQEVFLKLFGRGVCGWEYIVIRQESCSMDESGNIWECVMTWIGYKEGDELMMDTRQT